MFGLFDYLSGKSQMRSCGCSSSNELGGHEFSSRWEASSGAHNSKITVFVAKEIVTMDKTWPNATAVAVRDGRILSVGSLEDLGPWMKDSSNVVIDRSFEDKVIIPGFVEPHIHPLIGGTALSLPCIAYQDTPNPYGPTIKGCKSKASALQKLRDDLIKSDLQPDEPFLAWGWDAVGCGNYHLNRRDLDQVSTDRPIAVWDCSMHFCYTNTKAIEVLNLKPSLAKTTAGLPLFEDGTLAGSFLGVEAMKLVLSFWKRVGHVDRSIKSMLHLIELAKQGGVTTCAELLMGVFNMQLEENLFDLVFNHENVPMRCCVVQGGQNLVANSMGSSSRAVRRLRQMQQYTTPKLIYNNGVKFMMDDAFLGLTMCLNAPGYIDGHQGVWNNEPGREILEQMRPFWKAGCRLHVHSNGHASQDGLAKILANLQAEHPRFDHRFCFEHYGMSNEDLSRKLKTLGANASVNPFYVWHRADINAEHVGTDVAHSAARLKTLVDIGVPTGLHTDTPVAPPRPLEEMWIAVNRIGQSGQCKTPDERLTPYQALRCKTVDAAYLHGLDDVVGSIQAGKFADFTVLEENPLTVDPMHIRDIEIWGTVLGGRKFPRNDLIDFSLEQEPPEGMLPGLLWLFASTAQSPTWKRIIHFLADLKGVKYINANSSDQQANRNIRNFDGSGPGMGSKLTLSSVIAAGAAVAAYYMR
eukprot:Clim_evm6s243 gene=Clim_evmTU6s243